MAEEYQTKSEKDEGKVDLYGLADNMWKGLKRFWTACLALVVLCAAGSYIYKRATYKPEYRAYSTFVVSARNTMGYNASSYNTRVTDQLGAIFPYILTSDALNEIVCEDLGVNQIPGTIQAEALENTNLITISVRSDNAEQAYQVLESVLKNYPKVSEYVTGDVILDPLDESGVPSAPTNAFSAKKVIADGIVLSVVIVFILLLIYGASRKTISSEDDLKDILNVQVLCVVPHMRMKRRSAQNHFLINNQAVSGEFRESIRTLRTRFESACSQHEAHTILVTSSVPGEGKTTIASNLALSLTHRNFKVLLVDGDLRNPSVADCIGLAPGKGLIDYLENKVEITDILQPYKKLHILPGGGQVSTTANILNGQRMADLIQWATNNYDYVIIDTPPSSLVSDAAILTQYAQGIIYIIRQDYAKRNQILDGIDLLRDSHVPVVGCVLNDAEGGISGYGYGYSYYGKYGYGKYGYGDKQ